ncbi:MAG: GMC family oxidoreductase [Pseudobacteriovorax sp.]|nr:GMC family oxidoreductase [Pseudobacteriovorax sp.]
MKFDCEALVIGSGFGGSINSLRLSKKWPGQVILIERGKRYPMGSFARSPKDMSQNFFNLPEEQHKRPSNIGKKPSLGLFDIRSYDHMDIVVSAGLGGGSLIYANVFMAPPDSVFDHRWPEGTRLKDLEPYYKICKEVLGSRKIPDKPDWQLNKTRYFQKTALKMGRESKLVDINVFFGPDESGTIPPGVQAKNKYGALQSSCNNCAECDIGCNIHAKNTLDLNYLFVAENEFGLNIKTTHKALHIVPLNKLGHKDPEADGTHGYAVEVKDLEAGKLYTLHTKRLVVSAGTLGTNELLLKCRDEFKSLPRISQKLGTDFSGNGDFLSFIINSQYLVEPTKGPVITQRIDFNLFHDYDPKKAFIMEDASYPNLLAWFAEGEKPSFMKLSSIWNAGKKLISRLLSRPHLGRVGPILSRLLGDDISSRSSVHLCMGVDQSNGTMSLDAAQSFSVSWPYKDSAALYEGINQAVSTFNTMVNGEATFPLPTYAWPARRNVSVHPLGGCKIANDAKSGVTSAAPETFGKVFHYENLYVADGSLLPTAVGANPSLTISALSERVAEAITQIKPNADLLNHEEDMKHAG